MRSLQTAAGARTICQGHDFSRNLRGGGTHLGLVVECDPQVPQRPGLVRAWGDLTVELLAG